MGFVEGRVGDRLGLRWMGAGCSNRFQQSRHAVGEKSFLLLAEAHQRPRQSPLAGVAEHHSGLERYAGNHIVSCGGTAEGSRQGNHTTTPPGEPRALSSAARTRATRHLAPLIKKDERCAQFAAPGLTRGFVLN